MKHTLTGIALMGVVAASLTAGCGDLALNGTGAAGDGGGPHPSTPCGGSGDPCCNQTACNAGLTCHAGTCSGSSQGQDDATVEPTGDASMDRLDDSMGGPEAGDDADGDRVDAERMDADGPEPDASVDAGVPAEAAAACVATGTACMTTNPGACAAGTSECSDAGARVCRPSHTTQACYTGPGNTRSVGACKDGTQSCVGALGACTGQVIPATHDNCFTATDNDCNGTVGNGCPQSITLGADRTLAGAGGSGAVASTTTVHCPKGAYVTRVDSWFDDISEHATGVSIYCATPQLVAGASSYSVKLTASTPAPYQKAVGSVGGTDERDDDCGTTGLTGITYTVGLADNLIEGLGHHCGTSAVTLQADNTIAVNFTTTGDETYNTWVGQKGTFFDQACNSTEVVVGFTLRLGPWLTNIKPICAAVQITYK